jgi:ABC-2 type transport system permease protein
VSALVQPTLGRRLANIAAATRLYYSQALSVEIVYRFALLQSFFGACVLLLGLISFWVAAGQGSGPGARYSPRELVAYFVVATAFGILHENRISWNLSAAIRMGKLSASMLRPYPYLGSVVAQAAAHATIRTALLVPLIAMLVAVVPALGGPEGLEVAVWADRLGPLLAATVLSLAAGWLSRIAIGLLAFDMTQTWGPEIIFQAVYAVASGIGYPPDLLPEGLAALVHWTPVYYMIGLPTLIALGRISPAAALPELAHGVIVVILVGALVTVLWRRGVGRFEAIGI